MSDLVLFNGVVHTVDVADSVREAVAISGGRIVAVGTNEEVHTQAAPGARMVDLAGRTVVPGFVDAHPHLDAVGLRLSKPSFGLPKSIEDVLAVVRREAAARQPGEWIVCNPIASEPDVFAYPAALAEGRWPDRHDLDRAAPDNPVYIEPEALTAPGVAIVNSLALKIAGITADTEVPDGVRIRVDADGQPTGVIEDDNFPKRLPDQYGTMRPNCALFPMIPPLTHDDMVDAVRTGMRAFNARGVTAIYEGHGIPKPQQRAYLDLYHRGALSIRTYFVVSFPVPLYRDQAGGRALIAETSLYAGGNGFGDDLLKLGGLGFSFDSATAIGASLMREPYVGARGVPWHGVQHVDEAVFEQIALDAARAGLRVQVQCSGGLAIDKVLAAFEAVDRQVPLAGKRWAIEHCQFPSPENMAVCRRLGLVATSTANFLWNYGDIYRRSLGQELSDDAVPYRDWIDAGVMIAQSTDGRPSDPLFAIWQMLARQDGIAGGSFGLPRQKITRQEALRLYTYNAAYCAFWENEVGSIEPGKYADLAILSDDIMTIPEDAIPDVAVEATLLGGEIIHDAGVFGEGGAAS